MSRLEGASLWHVNVCSLGVTEDGELGSQLGQVEGGHLQDSALSDQPHPGPCRTCQGAAWDSSRAVAQKLSMSSFHHMRPLNLEVEPASEQRAGPHTVAYGLCVQWQEGLLPNAHLLIEVLGQHIHLVLVAAALPLVPELQLRNHLQAASKQTLNPKHISARLLLPDSLQQGKPKHADVLPAQYQAVSYPAAQPPCSFEAMLSLGP